MTGRIRTLASAGRPVGLVSIAALVQLKAMVGASPLPVRKRRIGPMSSSSASASPAGLLSRTDAPAPMRRSGPSRGRGARAGSGGTGRATGGSGSPMISAVCTRTTPWTARATSTARSICSAVRTMPSSVTTPPAASTSMGSVPTSTSLTSAVFTRTAVCAFSIAVRERAAQPADAAAATATRIRPAARRRKRQ